MKSGQLRAVKYGVTIIPLVIVSFIALVTFKEIRSLPRQVNINQDTALDSKLTYWDISVKRKYPERSLDQNGVPVFKLGDVLHYHPVRIAQFGLGAYEYYLDTGDARAKESFFRAADWLRDNLRRHGKFYYWEYTFEYPNVGTVPWFSAMAQGQGASVLLRAFGETHDEIYRERARDAIQPIFYDLSVGGISVVRGTAYIFPQEYPSVPPSSVLNGAISGYFGIYDYYRVTADPDVKRTADIIATTFARSIKDYDVGYWSLYSQRPAHLANGHYHAVHVAQLKRLYLITRDETFRTYADRFEKYQYDLLDRSRYVMANHLRQIRELTIDDIRRIPDYVTRTVWE